MYIILTKLANCVLFCQSLFNDVLEFVRFICDVLFQYLLVSLIEVSAEYKTYHLYHCFFAPEETVYI